MTEKLIPVKIVRYLRRNAEWPKFRLVGGELQRLVSEESVPEYLYKDEHTTEWRELEGR